MKLNCKIVNSKDIQEILNAFDVSNKLVNWVNRDENGMIYYIELKNGDYISNNHGKKTFSYHYKPRLWE